MSAEQKYVDTLLIEKAERANSHREIDRSIEGELKETLIEIRAFNKINVLFDKEKDMLSRIDPHDSMGMQSKIEQHLSENKNFLKSSKAYQHELEEHAEEKQPTPGSLDAQRHGIYTLQKRYNKDGQAILPRMIEQVEHTTLPLPIELQKDITRQKIGLMDEQLETIERLLKGQGSIEQEHGDSAKKPRTLKAAEIDYLQKLHSACIDQLRAGRHYHEKLEENSEVYATNTTVNRPLSEQLAMVQDLKYLYGQDTAQPERLQKLTNYQHTLETLSARQQEAPRASGERLDKQVEMVTDHISFFQLESMTVKNVVKRLNADIQRLQENKQPANIAANQASLDALHDQINALASTQHTLSSQLAAEKQYLQELEKFDSSKTQERLAKELDTFNPAKRRSNIVNELANLASSQRRSQQHSIRDAQQRLQELEDRDSSKIRAQTFVTRDTQKQLTMFDNLIKYIEKRQEYTQNKLQESLQSKNKLELSKQKISSDQAQVHPMRDTQHELVKHNLQHLRQKIQQYSKDIHEKGAQEEILRARLIHLGFCNDLLAQDSLSSISTSSANTRIWKEHKTSLQAEIQQLQQASSTQDNTKLETLQERLRQAEALDKLLLQERHEKRNISHMLPTRAWDYVEQLDLPRDNLQQLQAKIAVINHENSKRLNDHMKTFRKYYALHEWKQFHEFDTKMAMLHQQLDASREIMQQVGKRLEEVTTKIRHTHELLKVLAERKNESKHPFFLNEHMVPQDNLIKFDILPVSPSRVFVGTADSMCLPSSIRMICHDYDPSFASKVREVTNALSPTGDGSATIFDAPHVLQELGHPVSYTTIGIDSMHQLVDQMKFDRSGNCLPFIVNLERPDKPNYSKHSLVCNRIVEFNQHLYAVLRDPVMPNAFAVRLEHIDEVLMQAEINVVVPV